jgi:hypothetical protein
MCWALDLSVHSCTLVVAFPASPVVYREPVRAQALSFGAATIQRGLQVCKLQESLLRTWPSKHSLW